MQKKVIEILKENDKRNADVYQKFDPISGIGSIGERVEVRIDGFPLETQCIPVEMLSIPLVKLLIKCGSIIKFLTEELEVEYSEEDRLKVIEQFVRLRCRYDFAFWAALYVSSKTKVVETMYYFDSHALKGSLLSDLKSYAKPTSPYE